MFTITVIKDFITVKEYISFDEFINRIRNGYYASAITPIRKLVEAGDKKGADALKRRLLAITPAGKVMGDRNNNNITDYTRNMVLDFDDLTKDEILDVTRNVCFCPHTLAAFVSPSGNGLKVFVRVNSDAENHRKAFMQVQRYYQQLTNKKIDGSGKDIARLCFVSYDEHCYYNPEATDFNIQQEAKLDEKTPTVRKPMRITDIYNECIEATQRKYVFIEGSRNEFVFYLAIQMRLKGIAEGTTRMLLQQDFNFEEKEVLNCIKNAYAYNWTDQKKLPEAPKSKGKTPRKATSPVAIMPEEDLDNIDEKKSRKYKEVLYALEEVEKRLCNWYEFRYNVITGMIEYRPIHSDESYKELTDHEENSIFCELHHVEQYIPRNTLHTLLNSLFCPDFNPFFDYFSKLKPWDGVTDYIRQLSDTIKTRKDIYWAFCFVKWIVAFVASLLSWETINHTVIVLVGSQGLGKTTWMKNLLPKELKNYLATAVLQPDTKDTAMLIAQNALIILDELETLNKKNLNALKELITRPMVKIRRPFARNTESLPHIASFIAGVNFQQVLTDPSGTRRYLCVDTLSIDYQHTVDIDGVMAQALALYQSGFHFWFDMEEIKALEIHNADFVSKSVEEELINIWLRPVTEDEWKTRNQSVTGRNIQLLSASEIADLIIEKSKILLNDGTLVKIGKVLSKLGFTRVRRGNGHAFKVRILESDSVEQGKHNMDDVAEQRDQGMDDSTGQHDQGTDDDHLHDDDQQMEIIRRRSNGNLFTSAGEDFLPF